MKRYDKDSRIVMTLDAGGTNFVFGAAQGEKQIIPHFSIPAAADNLGHVLNNIRNGFKQVAAQLPEAASAISFCFPGPADYEQGIIGNLENLPTFKGGVALGPFLEDEFGIPVFINNDGDLFAYGEAIAGLLPEINSLLEKAGHPKRYRNLFGATFGTGFGGGIVSRDRMFAGDNSAQGEINRMDNKLYPGYSAEESVNIRGVKRVFAREAALSEKDCPEPREIFEIGMGRLPGNTDAAKKAFDEMAVVGGNALANAVTLTDGLIVLGGGLSGAWPLFLEKMVEEMNTPHKTFSGRPLDRLEIKVFNLQNPQQLQQFIEGERHQIVVPGSTRSISYDPLKRVGVGITRLGTSEAVAIGAYTFALHKLDCH
jgi:glucokinase